MNLTQTLLVMISLILAVIPVMTQVREEGKKALTAYGWMFIVLCGLQAFLVLRATSSSQLAELRSKNDALRRHVELVDSLGVALSRINELSATSRETEQRLQAVVNGLAGSSESIGEINSVVTSTLDSLYRYRLGIQDLAQSIESMDARVREVQYGKRIVGYTLTLNVDTASLYDEPGRDAFMDDFTSMVGGRGLCIPSWHDQDLDSDKNMYERLDNLWRGRGIPRLVVNVFCNDGDSICDASIIRYLNSGSDWLNVNSGSIAYCFSDYDPGSDVKIVQSRGFVHSDLDGARVELFLDDHHCYQLCMISGIWSFSIYLEDGYSNGVFQPEILPTVEEMAADCSVRFTLCLPVGDRGSLEGGIDVWP